MVIRPTRPAVRAHRFAEETVTYMSTSDLLSAWGLRPVELSDRPTLDPFFSSLEHPLSDYTFSQLFTWRNSLRIAWTTLEGHLCVFANGSGDLTLLLPPIGDTSSDRALARAVEIMDDYNAAHACPDHSRVEYVSEELLARFDTARLGVAPQGNDYLYDVRRMIDLPGGDLASKRQAKNRFARNYVHRAEPYDPANHFDGCLALLDQWKDRQDAAHADAATASATKRVKEALATQLTLRHAPDLGLPGMVVYVRDPDGQDRIRGFTFGEDLGADQSSIVVEKTDLECKGLAQFIFSEFCRTTWAHRPLVNAGDDWGLETLAWTKSSYRPVKLLRKFVVTPPVRVAVSVAPSAQAADAIATTQAIPEPIEDLVAAAAPAQDSALSTQDLSFPTSLFADLPGAADRRPSSPHLPTPPSEDLTLRPATREDLGRVAQLERACFTSYTLSPRQLNYLRGRQTSIFLVAEAGGQVIGEGIALLRHHRTGASGRIYSLAVDPQRRRGGIGEKIIRALLEQLRERGARRVYLEVEESNAPALRLYQRLGFVSIGTLADYYGPGRNGVHMMYATESRVTASAA